MVRYHRIDDSISIRVDQYQHSFRSTSRHQPQLCRDIERQNVAAVLFVSVPVTVLPDLSEVDAVENLDRAFESSGDEPDVLVVLQTCDFVLLHLQVDVLILC